jgi:hypothetical protein
MLFPWGIFSHLISILFVSQKKFLKREAKNLRKGTSHLINRARNPIPFSYKKQFSFGKRKRNGVFDGFFIDGEEQREFSGDRR